MSLAKKILLVEDDIDQRSYITAMLNNANFDVVEAESAADALKKFATQHFDIVVTDISMPEVNGLEFASQLKSIYGHECVPIVLMTAGADLIDFSKTSFRADAFCMKQQIANLVPQIEGLL